MPRSRRRAPATPAKASRWWRRKGRASPIRRPRRPRRSRRRSPACRAPRARQCRRSRASAGRSERSTRSRRRSPRRSKNRARRRRKSRATSKRPRRAPAKCRATSSASTRRRPRRARHRTRSSPRPRNSASRRRRCAPMSIAFSPISEPPEPRADLSVRRKRAGVVAPASSRLSRFRRNRRQSDLRSGERHAGRRPVLRDDVGQELALQLGDLVLEEELALLQALKLEQVERRLLGEPRDDLVEIAVLAAQRLELALGCFDVEVHRSCGQPDRIERNYSKFPDHEYIQGSRPLARGTPMARQPRPAKTIGILTSGGDCSGLSAADRAVVCRAIEGYGWRGLCLRQGTMGLMRRPVEVEELGLRLVTTNILRMGGTILGTTNKGDPFAFPMPDGSLRDRSAELIAGYRELGLDALIGIGGD